MFDHLWRNLYIASLAAFGLAKDGGSIYVDGGGATNLDASCFKIDVAYLECENLADAAAGVGHEFDGDSVWRSAGHYLGGLHQLLHLLVVEKIFSAWRVFGRAIDLAGLVDNQPNSTA